MEGVEAAAGRQLPAEADAVVAGSLPAAAPARTWGSAKAGRGGVCAEHFGAGRRTWWKQSGGGWSP